MPETGQFVIFLNPDQSQPCPACGEPTDLASQVRNNVLVPESELSLANHRVTKRLNGYLITATVTCPSCSNAFDIEANAARFKSDQMKCRICRKSEYMKPDVRDVRYDKERDVYIVAAIVYCRHCWILAWLLSSSFALIAINVCETGCIYTAS